MFCTKNGTALSAGNVRRDFRKILKDAGLVDAEWTPREMRHSFVSLLSDSGVLIEHISRLVGHANTVRPEERKPRGELEGAAADLRDLALIRSWISYPAKGA
ncbi:tyrosine-type recombinase/integrase [Sphaerisporangium sp. NBC_01403]|uniref:tyrosine-type recombinase/integrase n=1 Tax=Sphaerisporangium sp. NBC_01403 TaxID=2903599 RepID=UPI00324FD892